MALSANHPVVSKPLYLQDIEPIIKLMEHVDGRECPREQQAYVIIRQPTEGDMMRLNELSRSNTIEYAADGSVRTTARNVDERDSWRVHLCLAGIGNIHDSSGDGPIFQFENAGGYERIKGSYDEFMKQWRTLPDIVSSTIIYLVTNANTLVWGEEKGEEVSSESI